eukprot:COSAG04_NODE_346_length_16127_cov_10.497442_8_plen_776_part_00
MSGTDGPDGGPPATQSPDEALTAAFEALLSAGHTTVPSVLTLGDGSHVELTPEVQEKLQSLLQKRAELEKMQGELAAAQDALGGPNSADKLAELFANPAEPTNAAALEALTRMIGADEAVALAYGAAVSAGVPHMPPVAERAERIISSAARLGDDVARRALAAAIMRTNDQLHVATEWLLRTHEYAAVLALFAELAPIIVAESKTGLEHCFIRQGPDGKQHARGAAPTKMFWGTLAKSITGKGKVTAATEQIAAIVIKFLEASRDEHGKLTLPEDSIWAEFCPSGATFHSMGCAQPGSISALGALLHKLQTVLCCGPNLPELLKEFVMCTFGEMTVQRGDSRLRGMEFQICAGGSLMVKGSGRYGDPELCYVYADNDEGKKLHFDYYNQPQGPGLVAMGKFGGTITAWGQENGVEMAAMARHGGWTGELTSLSGMQLPSDATNNYKTVESPKMLGDVFHEGSYERAVLDCCERLKVPMPTYDGPEPPTNSHFRRRKAEADTGKARMVQNLIRNLKENTSVCGKAEAVVNFTVADGVGIAAGRPGHAGQLLANEATARQVREALGVESLRIADPLDDRAVVVVERREQTRRVSAAQAEKLGALQIFICNHCQAKTSERSAPPEWCYSCRTESGVGFSIVEPVDETLEVPSPGLRVGMRVRRGATGGSGQHYSKSKGNVASEAADQQFELRVNLDARPEAPADGRQRVSVRRVGATALDGKDAIALSRLYCGTLEPHQHPGVGGPIDCCGDRSLMELLALMTPQPEPTSGRPRRRGR